MSNYKSLIDEAMKTAQYRLNAGVTKEASAANDDSLIKEASELANALEYMSMDSANEGSVVGEARAEIIRDFHKAATAQRLGVKLAGDVGESSTTVSGMQYLPPQNGKTKLTAKLDKDGNPLVTSSPDSTGHTMLESYKQASTGTTLYDILMHEKQAGNVGEYDAEQYMPITGANENSNRRILDDAYVLSGVTKQEAKAPVRDRLREAFASTSDTLGDQTVKSMFPAAYQASGLRKTAGFTEADASGSEKLAAKPSKREKAGRRQKKKDDINARRNRPKKVVKTPILPARSPAEQRGAKFKNFRVAAPVRGSHDIVKGTAFRQGSIDVGSIKAPKRSLKGPQVKAYATGLTASDRNLIGDPVVHKAKYKSNVKSPKGAANKRPKVITLPPEGTKARPKKFTGNISAPTGSNMRGPMIMNYPTRRRVNVRAGTTPTSAPAAPSIKKSVEKASKSVAKKSKSLGRGSQAAILGGALLTGMAAKGYVNRKRKGATK